MNTPRWDETWHRLLEWTNDQGPSERLAAQVLLHEGFKDLDPSHPLGGKDGGKDAICIREGIRWVMGVYFPRGQQPFKDIEVKFRADLLGAQKNKADRFAFVTNQELRLAERQILTSAWPNRIELYHLERVTAILDSPAMQSVRKQFLGIDYDDRPCGGRGGDAEAESGGTAAGGGGGDAGPFGSGGPGGDGRAVGEGSWAKGGPGGRGGVGSGGPGTDAAATDGGLSMGGEGGEAGQPDGEGGRGGQSGGQLLGLTEIRLPDGRSPGEGGHGANSAAYDGKVATIKMLCRSYLKEHPQCRSTSLENKDIVRLVWLNKRLQDMGANWRVEVVEGEYRFFVTESHSTHVSDQEVQGARNETTISSTSQEELPPKPRGIALVICHRSEWKNQGNPSLSCHRDLFGTFDSCSFEQFPHAYGPKSAYMLVAGGGKMEFSLQLEAPGGEIVVARHWVASNWGVLRTCECSVHIDEFQLREPGVYHWKLLHEDNVLLSRPMLVTRRIERSKAGPTVEPKPKP